MTTEDQLAGGLSSYRLSDWRDTIGELEAAEKSAGAQLVTTYYLGRSFESLGDRSRAAEKYKLIVQSGATGDQASYAKGRLVEWGVLSQTPQQQPSPH